MTTHNFSIEDLAQSLVVHLDRQHIFPPLINNPESFLPPIDNMTKSSLRRPKRSPNAFLVCRRNVLEEASRKGTYNMRVISKVTGILWKNASLKEKNDYKKIADRVYEIHNRRTLEIQQKMKTSSFYKPYNSFSLQPKEASPKAPPKAPEKPLTAPLHSPPVSLPVSPPVSPPTPLSIFFPTFSFNRFDVGANETILKNHNLEFISPNNEVQNRFLPYYINDILIFPQNF